MPITYAYVATHNHFVRGRDRQVFRGGASAPIIKLRAHIEENWNAQEPVVLDFSGVRVASVSFLDEALGLLARAHGTEVLASEVRLDWRTLDLYGLLFQYLGNGTDEAAALGFRRLAERQGESQRTDTSWQVPRALRESEALQKEVFAAIAGPFMGRDRRRGQTCTWVSNHLADALNNVSPRSFLAAIGRAAREPPKPPCALHWSGIQEGVRRASKIRVDEIQEDLPWAHDAMSLLEDLVVPCRGATARTARGRRRSRQRRSRWFRGLHPHRARGARPRRSCR